MCCWCSSGELVHDLNTGADFYAEIHEDAPTDEEGETKQRVTILLDQQRRLSPPTRLRLPDGAEVRVLGSQIGPRWDPTTLVTCERVNADLPDAVELHRCTETFDEVKNQIGVTTELLWSGSAHIIGPDPQIIETAGERAPLDRVQVKLPLGAPIADGLLLHVVGSRHPSLSDASYQLAGEVDSSTAALRTVRAYRLEER